MAAYVGYLVGDAAVCRLPLAPAPLLLHAERGPELPRCGCGSSAAAGGAGRIVLETPEVFT